MSLYDKILDKIKALEAEKKRLESLMGNENSEEFTPLRLAFEKAHEESCAYSNLHSRVDQRTEAVWAECERLRVIADRAQDAFNLAWMGNEAHTYLPRIEWKIDMLEARLNTEVFEEESRY